MPENLAYVIYTSGSTGQPKGVGNTHRGIVTSLDWIIGELGISAADATVQRCDYTFDVSIWEIFSILTVGGVLILPRPGGARDSTHVAELVIQYGGTTLFAVPTMLSELIDNEHSAGCRSLRNIVAIGEALPGLLQQRVHERLPTVRFWNSYGPTEAAVGVTLWLCRRQDGAKPPPIGAPAWNTQIHILDETLRPVPDGESGELYIAGDFLARGYVGKPELTAERFIPSPFGPPGARMYRTGDLAQRRADGEIFFLGRNDSQVKFNGIRVELGEIEAAVSRLPGVARTAVIAREIGGENRLIAYVIMKPGARPIVPAEAKSFLGQFLPRYLVPSFFVPLAAFPLTASAKLNARALPDPDINVGAAPFREPTGDLEVFFAETFAQLMGAPRVGADDSFFDLGGTSLTAMRLASRTKTKTGLILPMRALVEHPTPAALAKVMGQLRNGEDIFTGLPFDSRPVVFVLPGAGGSDISLVGFVIACDPVLDLRILDYPDWKSLCAPDMTFQRWVDGLTERLLAAAPAGPINLTGYSLGGDVAYELAQNLRRRGRQIGFLGIIDTDAPSTRTDKAASTGGVGRITRKIARLVHDREIGLAVMINLLARVPPRYLPVLSRVLSIGSIERRERVESRMVTTIGMTLRRSWLGDGDDLSAARSADLPVPRRIERVGRRSLRRLVGALLRRQDRGGRRRPSDDSQP